jgi:chemotaxis protein CheX
MTPTAPGHPGQGPAVEGGLGDLEPMAEILAQVTLDVFATMVRLPLVPSARPSATRERPPVGIIGTVGFAGSATGLVSLGAPKAAGLEITGAMLGMEPEAVVADVPDAIGEVTNMIAGSFRTRMAAGGQKWSITMPVVTVGHDLVGHSSGAAHVVCPFTLGPHALFVELARQVE